jgi:hypothetical protein
MIRPARGAFALAGLASLLVVAATSCSGANDSALGSTSGPGSGTGSGSGSGSGSGTGSGSGSGSGSSDASLGINQDDSTTLMEDGSACAADSRKAKLVPLDMYIMMDQSGSMGPQSGTPTRWSNVTQALTTFMNQPDSDGIGVGIAYFPLNQGQCYSDGQCQKAGHCNYAYGGACQDSCNPDDYVTDVDIEALPSVGPKILSSLGAHHPGGSTPTSAALTHAVNHARDFAKEHPTHTTIVVLATDGVPQGCDEDVNNIAAIAATGANGSPKVLTFVIGMGDLSKLNTIAQGGGTSEAILVDPTNNTAQGFIDAMNKIRGAALTCSYTIPAAEAGAADPGKVNIRYTPGSGGAQQLLGKVANKAACDPTKGGWYYDDDANPTHILMCDSTCKTLTADTTGALDILLGCRTVIN